ncbi:CHRD domain-containing protein [Haladaptatus sp.]|uniref:CHRD domain-containing protein n=1 Tax=Haladaptatus sp. TaxID=1973141 RepID=UPI003C3EA86D
MVDQRKRRTMQVLGMGLTGLAGISSGNAMLNGNGASMGKDGSKGSKGKKSKGKNSPQIALEGQLYSTSTLSGKKEVPKNRSPGEGVAAFRSTPDKKRLDFALLAINTTSQITAAHLHLGEKGENGPVVASLIGEDVDAQQLLILNNVASTGSIRASDLVGPLEGDSIADLISEIRAGNVYVNVHTEKYADGEIRGQVCTASKLDVGFEGDITGVSRDSVIGIWYDLSLDVDLKKKRSHHGGDGHHGDDGHGGWDHCKPKHGKDGKDDE